MTKTPTAAPVAASPSPAPTAAATEAPKVSKIAPVKSVLRIDGVIEPGTLFVPRDDAQRAELFDLNAVEDLSEAEAAVSDKLNLPTHGELTASLDNDKALRVKEAQQRELAAEYMQRTMNAAVDKAINKDGAASGPDAGSDF